MATNKFIAKLLHLKGLKVSSFYFSNRNKTLTLFVKPHKNGCRCPECSRRCKTLRVMPQRTWRDIVVCSWSILFAYCPREILCPTHGRVQEDIPWADAYARVTYRLEYVLLVYCQIMTQKAAARLLKLSSSTLSNILHRCITRIRSGHKIRGLRSIGIDEVSYCKGRKFATVVYDLQRSCVLWVGCGKGRETIDVFFNEMLSDHQKLQIKSACCDMGEAYIGAIEHHCPNATLVLDRFHVVKAMNEAVDDVREQQWREASGDDRKALKGLRWLLYKHPPYLSCLGSEG